MAKVLDRIALGIGAQVDQATPLAAVEDATALISGAASGTDATGIFVDKNNVQFGFNRVESDPRMFEDTLRPLAGTFYRVEPTLSFSMDVVGGGQTLTTPASGEYDLTEAMERILAGAGFDGGTSSSSNTTYGVEASSIEYQTLKLWRGDSTTSNRDEAWVFVGCVFDVTWNFTAGEKATMDVTVHADSVIHKAAGATDSTNVNFPTSINYGTQDSTTLPVMRDSQAIIGADTRGIVSGSISLTNEIQEVGDSNSATGVLKEHTGRMIEWSGDFYTDDTSAADVGIDYDTLVGNVSENIEVKFFLGAASTSTGEVANALKFTIPNARFTATTKADGGLNVIRSVGAYAVTNTAGNESQFNIKGL